MSDQLQRCVIQTEYTTPKGFAFQIGDVLQGSQSRIGGPVEVHVYKTDERVCFSARECGLPTTCPVWPRVPEFCADCEKED